MSAIPTPFAPPAPPWGCADTSRRSCRSRSRSGRGVDGRDDDRGYARGHGHGRPDVRDEDAL